MYKKKVSFYGKYMYKKETDIYVINDFIVDHYLVSIHLAKKCQYVISLDSFGGIKINEFVKGVIVYHLRFSEVNSIAAFENYIVIKNKFKRLKMIKFQLNDLINLESRSNFLEISYF